MTPELINTIVTIAVILLGGLFVGHLIVEARARWIAFRRRVLIAAAASPIFILILAWFGWVPWYVTLAAVLAVALLVWRRWVPSTASTVTRWSERARRRSGVASRLDVLITGSASAVRRKTAGVVRPSLDGLPRRQVATEEYAVRLCRAGGMTVWGSREDVTLVFGGPRKGKSGWLADEIVSAPGAALVTSTRLDLLQNTADLRPGPALVFNAGGLGGLTSTITFDPLSGCENPSTAHARASDLLSPTNTAGGGDRQYWNEQGRRVLAAFLHGAALAGLSMRDVLRWVADPDRSEREIASALRNSRTPDYVLHANQFVNTNDRTRSSITSTIMPALGWLTSDVACAAAAPIPEYQWTVETILYSRATVYLLGDPDETLWAPLVSAFVGHIARECRRVAATQRLDPPMTMALDEAALAAPDSVINWSADMGGRGVTIIAALQSRAQLLARWGRDDAATLINNAGNVLLFGGTKDRDDLEFWSTLGGPRDESVATTDPHGRVKTMTSRKVQVLEPSEIRKLRPFRVIVFRDGLSPVVGRARMVWERPDVRDGRTALAARWHAFLRRLTNRLVEDEA